MQFNPVSMPPERPIRDAIRLIFNLGVSAVIVVKDKKPIGIITEEDILQRLFPSVRDFMEDFTHARSFGLMEERLPEVMQNPVKSLMTTPIKTITKDTPLMKALSMMLLNNFSHIPVINDKKELVGIISQGDIFRAIASSEIPHDTDQEYHDWIARHFDMVSSSIKRYEIETEALVNLFKKHGVKKTINIGAGTGSHDILFAEAGLSTYGLEKSKRMYLASMGKKLKLPQDTQQRVNFMQAQKYEIMLDMLEPNFDAALFMGNALAHIPNHYEEVLRETVKKLKGDDSIVVIQLTNVEKIFHRGRRLRNFTVSPSKLTAKREFAFLEFYDPKREENDTIMLNMAVFAHNGRRWTFRGLNNTDLAYIPKDTIEKLLRKLGFSNVTFYGSRFLEPILERKPDFNNDDWITIVGER
jgi:CBS domain-containing protein